MRLQTNSFGFGFFDNKEIPIRDYVQKQVLQTLRGSKTDRIIKEHRKKLLKEGHFRALGGSGFLPTAPTIEEFWKGAGFKVQGSRILGFCILGFKVLRFRAPPDGC